MQKLPEIIAKNPDDLIPYTKNSLDHPEEQITQLAGQIAAFGFDQPIVCDKDWVIIKGHARLLASKKLGLKLVPVIVSTLDEYQAMAARIADNKVRELATWNQQMLMFDVNTLRLHEFDLGLTALPAAELKLLVSQDPGLAGSTPSGNPDANDAYTKKITAPIYEPKGEKPALDDLVDYDKTDKLVATITNSDVPEDVKEFLLSAAERHNVFNFEKIAEYYSHASKEVQELMEQSALVIIDFNKAIENGFVKLTNEIAEIYTQGEK